MPKMEDSTLKAILDAERQDALGTTFQTTGSSKLYHQRVAALDYYLGDVSSDLPDITGRSSAVSMDVADTIEGLMPSLLEIFAGSDDAVRFMPLGQDDGAAAEQETAYVRHVFWEKNAGYLVLYSMIKDALLSKLGIAKVWWDEDVSHEEETYEGISDDEFMMLVMDPNVEVIAHTVYEEPGDMVLPHMPMIQPPNVQGGMAPQQQRPATNITVNTPPPVGTK